MTLEDIAGDLRMHPTRAAHYLSKLQDSEHVGGVFTVGESTRYFLEDRGLEYAVNHKFV